MNYDESLVFLKECTKFGIKLSLERITELMKRLGNPERQFRTIHVAGTNGKGSTTAMLEAVLRAAGFKTARFNSPHLSSYRERYTVNGVNITKEQLATIMTELQPVLQSLINDGFGAPTEFEVGTALAFQYFAQERVDWAIIEVGMGGRFDATNIIGPVLSIITHIAMDHQEYLGDTLTKIAFEKAGIIKTATPVVVGVQEPELTNFFQEIAASRGASLSLAEDIRLTRYTLSEAGLECQYEQSCFGSINLQISLIGRHQADNCRNVLAAVAVLRQLGFRIELGAVIAGLAQVKWPGRLERMDGYEPLKLYLDGAHNPDGAQAMVDSIREIYPATKVDLLVGILNNRPLPEIAGILAEIAGKVIVTGVPDPKTAVPAELGAVFRSVGVADVVVEPEPDQALSLLLKSSTGIAVVTGSLYLIGYLRSRLLKIGD